MNKQQATGTAVKIRGDIERLLGRLTGNRRRQARGVAHQVEGDLRHGVGDAQATLKGHGGEHPKG